MLTKGNIVDRANDERRIEHSVRASNLERLRQDYEEAVAVWNLFSAKPSNWINRQQRKEFVQKRLAYQDAKLAYWCAIADISGDPRRN